jgi:hypothetical protein
MRTTPKLFVMLLVHDYDSIPRSQFIEHEVTSVEKAKVLRTRLEKLIGTKGFATNRTGRWLARYHGIDGFVQRVDWLYERIVTKVDA